MQRTNENVDLMGDRGIIEQPATETDGRPLWRRLLPRMFTSQATVQPTQASGVHAMKVDCGTAGDALPHGHPSLNGAASDFDPIRRAAFFFGGGSPHAEVYNVTSALRLSGVGGGQAGVSVAELRL